MWRRLVLAVLAVVALIGGGCSLLVSTDGLTTAPVADEGGGPDGAPKDASSDAFVVPDAESGAPMDAATDGSDGSPPVAFCASVVPAPKYCADFDTGMPSDYGKLVGTPTFDTAETKSPPRSLLASVPVNSISTNRSCEIDHALPDAPMSYAGSFDVLVDAVDATHDIELLTVFLTQDANDYCVTDVAVRSGGYWTFDESCYANGVQQAVNAHVSTKHVVLGTWLHVEYAVNFGARTFSFKVAGEVLDDAVTILPSLTTGKVDLFLGLTYVQVDAVSAATIHVDNVVFDYP